jgi:hypothetical protein
MGVAKFTKIENLIYTNSKRYFLSILKKRNIFVNILSRLSIFAKSQLRICLNEIKKEAEAVYR